MKFQYFNFTKFVLKCLWIIWTVIPIINGLKVDSDGKEHDVDLIMPGKYFFFCHPPVEPAIRKKIYKLFEKLKHF